MVLPRLFLLLAALTGVILSDLAGQTIGPQREAILQAQDARDATAHILAEALSSRDSELRYQAALACASIQDTTFLRLLVPLVDDPDPTVSEAAALALGQTGSVLSPAGRTQLLAELHPRLVSGGWSPRLVEELGKVVTAAGLDTLVAISHWKSDAPDVDLCVAAARAAIRGIVSERATRFLMASIDGVKSRWQAVYALQRIGDHPEIRAGFSRLAPLVGHPDPLVRMNLATLLGKLPGVTLRESLVRQLAFEDRDPRVRVNALRVVASLTGDESTRAALMTALTNPDIHIASTAAATLGRMRPPDGVDSLQFLNRTNSILDSVLARGSLAWQVRAEAATALAERTGEAALPRILSLAADNLWMRARLVRASGSTGSLDAVAVLEASVMEKSPLVACAALDALMNVLQRHPGDKHAADRVFVCALRALESQDMAVRTTAAALLGDSLLARPEAVEPLLAAGRTVKLPDDVEVLQQIMQALGNIRDERALPFLREQLATAYPGTGEPAAKAIGAISGLQPPLPRDRSNRSLPDLATLRSLPDTLFLRMETSKGIVHIEVYPRMAPFTVVSFIKLVREGFYRGTVCHRVVPNFVVQGGDPRGDGWGGPGYAIRSEFSTLRFETGSLGMASAGKDTEGSQFFITHSPQPHLDGRYTVFGKVVNGMDVVYALQIGDLIKDVVLEF